MSDPLIRNEKLVAAHISTELADWFTLVSVFNQKAKSEIIRELISGYVTPHAPQALFKRIARKVLKDWGGTDFRTYQKEVREALEKKHLPEKKIDRIILEMRRLYEANKR